MRVCAALLLLCCAAVAGMEFDIVELDGPEHVSYRILRDLDGDGLDELMLVTPTEIWLWNGRKEGLRPKPDRVLKLPAGAALFDVTDIDGTPQSREILVRTGIGWWVVPTAGDPRRLGYPAGLGLPHNSKQILWRQLAADMDGDGKPEVVDVSLAGYQLFYGKDEPVILPPALRETVETTALHANERYRQRISIGSWVAGRFDKGPSLDFATVDAQGLRVFTGGDDGRFSRERSHRIHLPEAKEHRLEFVDFNGDGWMDVLAVNRPVGHAVVLMALEDWGLNDGRRLVLSVPGYMRYPVLDDLNGDGLPDLALPYVPSPSVGDGVRIFVRSEVRIKVPLFLNRGGKTPFRRTADRVLTLPVKVRLMTEASGRLSLGGVIVVEHEGDLDGDGRRDLLVSREPALLGIYRGVPETLFEEKPAATVAIPDPTEYAQIKSAAGELNGDRRSDILVHYQGRGDRRDKLVLLLSRKK